MCKLLFEPMNSLFISIISGLGSMFAWGTGDVLAKKNTEKVGSFGLFLWVQIFGLIFNIVLFSFTRPAINLTSEIIILIFISAVVGCVSYLLIFKAFEIGNVAVISPINSAYTIFTIPTAFLLLHKTVSIGRLIAIIIVIMGVIIVATNFAELKKGNLDLKRGVKEILIGIVLIGLVLIPLNDFILGKVDWIVFSLLGRVLGTIIAFTLFATKFRKSASLKMPKNALVPVFIFSFLDFIAICFYQFGQSHGNIIIVAPISSGFTVITVLLSVIFLKEKLSLTQVLGIIFTVTGIVTLSII